MYAPVSRNVFWIYGALQINIIIIIICLKAVWTRLPPSPDACLELVICTCKSKCRTTQRKCFNKNLNWTYACRCDGADCCNAAGHAIPHIALDSRLDTSLRCIDYAYVNIRVKRPSVQHYSKVKTMFREKITFMFHYTMYYTLAL